MQYYVIGEREIVLAFRLIGIDGTAAVNREEALDAFNHVTGQSQFPVEELPRVLILTEEVSMMLDEEVMRWQKKADYPLIVEVPGIHGYLSDRKTLTDTIREAVGISV